MASIALIVIFPLWVWTTASGQPTSFKCGVPVFEEAVYKGSIQRHYPGGKLKLSCKENYYDADTSVTCMPNGIWSPPSPPCTLVRCDQAPIVRHGTHEWIRGLYNDTRRVHCDEGYRYNGTQERRCQRDGTWSGIGGICTEIECPQLIPPKRSRLSSTARIYQSIVSIICPERYYYSGSQARQCLANKTWSGRSGICKVVECPELKDPVHGHIEVSTRWYNDSATIRCNEGYNYSHPQHGTVYCQRNNTWSTQLGECQGVWCPLLPNVEHGVLSVHAAQYMDHIELQCQSGYSVDGISKVTCMSDGTYNTKLGICRRNKGTNLLFLLFILLAIAFLVLMAYFIWKHLNRKRPLNRKTSEHHDIGEMERLFPNKQVHVAFKIKDSDGNQDVANFKKCLVKSIRKAFENENVRKCDGDPPDLHVKYISSRKDYVLLRIKCDGTDRRIMSALENTDILAGPTIDASSITFMDPVGAAVASEIYKQRHVTDQTEDRKIDLTTQYVRLRLLDIENLPALHKDNIQVNPDQDRPDHYQFFLEQCGGKDIKEEELVTENETGKLVLLRGRAGIGKSTTVQHIFWKWAHGEWGKRFKAILLLNVRHFLHIQSIFELWRFLSIHSVYAPGNASESWLEENEDQLCIFLDGIDEIWTFKKMWNAERSTAELRTGLEWCFSLLQRKSLSSATIITSSRPFTDLSLIKACKLVELMGLTRETVIQFVEGNVTRERVPYVTKTLTDNPILLSVSSITYYCAALCRVLEGTDLGPEDLKTYTQINAYIVEEYIRRCLKRDDGILPDINPSIQAISKLAYSGLLKTGPTDITHLVFSQSEYDEIGVSKEQIELMCRAGIFNQSSVPVPERPGTEQTIGQFVHLSIQEFLAMTGYLLQEGSDAEDAISEMFESGHFVMAQLYLFGLVFNSNHKWVKTVTGRLRVSDEKMKNLQKDLQDKFLGGEAFRGLLGMQCIHEAQSEQMAELYAEKWLESGVRFANTPLTAIDVNAIEFTLKHHRHSLTRFRLENVNLDVTTIGTIVGIVNTSPNLETFDVTDKDINKECLQILERGWDNSTLPNLGLGYGPIGDGGIVSIKRLLGKARGVNRLHIRCYNVTDTEYINNLNALRAHPILHGIGVDSDDLTDEGVKEGTLAIKQNTNIDTVVFASSKITKVGVQHIADLMSSATHVQRVRLYISSIQEEGVRAIMAAMDRNKTVNMELYLTQHCSAPLQAKLEAISHRLKLGTWRMFSQQHQQKRLQVAQVGAAD